MKYLTYKDLFEHIKGMSEEQLNQTATVFIEDEDEGYPISFWRHMVGSDVYDDGQLVMSVDAELP